MLSHQLRASAKTPVYVGGISLGFIGGVVTATQTLSLTTLTGGISASAAPGDMVIVAYSNGHTAALVPTIVSTGYTAMFTALYANSTQDVNLLAWYKFMGNTPDTSVVVGGSGNIAAAGAVAIHVWRNINPSTPFSGTITTGSITNGSNPTNGTSTFTSTGTTVVCLGASGNLGAGSLYTAGTGLTRLVTAGGNDTVDTSIALAAITARNTGSYTPPAPTFTLGFGTATTNAAAWATIPLKSIGY